MRTLLVTAWLTLSVGMAFAQSDRGTITGTVSDPAGAVVPNVPIQAKNVETGVVYEGATSTTGNYALVQLPAGTYEVSVGVQGFKKYTRTGLVIQVAQTLRIDILLEVGATSESVTVTEAAPLLNTESGELSHNVASNSLDELPILGIGSGQSGTAGIRNPYAMMQLIPGSTWTPNSVVRINGTPANSQSFRIEGQEAANTGLPGSAQQNQPSVDAIQEVAIQTSNYAAEFGQVGGGVFNLTMKSGTNQFHGTAYDYFVNEVFNAGNPFTQSPAGNPRARARRNDYGFTLGGPVWIPRVYNGHNKTFFFFNWEQFRENTVTNNQFQTVPTEAYRQGNLARAVTTRVIGTDPLGRQMLEGMVHDPNTTRTVNGLQIRDQFPGNIIPPSRFDPVAAKIQALFPPPGGPTPNGLTNNYLNPYATSRTTEVPSVKIDQTIGSKGKLSFYWSRTKTANPNGNPTTGSSDGLPVPLTQASATFTTAPIYRLNYDYTVTPTLLLHLGGGYRSVSFAVPPLVENYNVEQQLGLRGGIENKWFPVMSGMLATNGTGGMVTIGSESGQVIITQSPSFNTSLTWVKSNHTYKFGSEFRTEGYPPNVDQSTVGNYTFAAAETGQPFQNTNVSGSNVGFAYASFLLGGVDQISISRPTRPRLGKKQFGFYAQDSWKVTRQLTLDYGLRYDYSTYLQEEYGRAADFSATTPNPSAGGILGAAIYDRSGPGHCNCNIAHNYPYAGAPRLGVAYQINSKTVFRAGFGIVYAGTEANNNAASGTQAGGGLGIDSASNNSPSFGFPVATLAQGYPSADYPPEWPNFSPGQFPTSAPVPGLGPVLMDPNAGRPARQYQWSIGLQRVITRDLVVEASYVANRGVWWQAPGLLNLNAITPARLQAFGLDINNSADRALLTSQMSSAAVIARRFTIPYPGFPTSQLLSQALRPFPQFTTIPVYWDPLGKTWYDSLQVKATKRLSHGLSLLSTFSWSKAQTLGTELAEPSPGSTGNAIVNDVFNRNTNKYISVYNQPFLFNFAMSYTTPKINKNQVLSWVARDWTYGVFLQNASGFPIAAPAAQSNLNNYLFQGSSFASRVRGQPLFTAGLNCHCYDPNKAFVLNPNAWVDPPAGQFGTSAAYYSDYRTQRRPQQNMNMGRSWRIKEKASFNLRMEFTNVFNRAYWGNPSNTNAKLAQVTLSNGNASAGFGKLTTSFTAANTLPRMGVVVGRFTF